MHGILLKTRNEIIGAYLIVIKSIKMQMLAEGRIRGFFYLEYNDGPAPKNQVVRKWTCSKESGGDVEYLQWQTEKKTGICGPPADNCCIEHHLTNVAVGGRVGKKKKNYRLAATAATRTTTTTTAAATTTTTTAMARTAITTIATSTITQ